jgi:hypothetical protein
MAAEGVFWSADSKALYVDKRTLDGFHFLVHQNLKQLFCDPIAKEYNTPGWFSLVLCIFHYT